MKNTGKKARKQTFEFGRKALAVLMAFTLIATEAPVQALGEVAQTVSSATKAAEAPAPATEEAGAKKEPAVQAKEPAADAKAATANKAPTDKIARVSLKLDEYTYIEYKDASGATQTVDFKLAAPLSIPTGADFKFAVKSVTGYENPIVEYELNGERQELKANAQGIYTLPAAAITSGLVLAAESAKVSGTTEEEAPSTVEAAKPTVTQEESPAPAATPSSDGAGTRESTVDVVLPNETQTTPKVESAPSGSLVVSIQFTDQNGQAKDPALSTRLYAYIRSKKWDRKIAVPLSDAGNGLYKATVNGLLDQNGNKNNGEYFPVESDAAFVVKVFSPNNGVTINENWHEDYNNLTVYENGSLIDGSYVVSAPSNEMVVTASNALALTASFREKKKLTVGLQLQDATGAAVNAQLKESVYAYVRLTSSTAKQITAKLQDRGNGLYTADVDGLLDTNRNKNNGNYLTVEDGEAYTATLFRVTNNDQISEQSDIRAKLEGGDRNYPVLSNGSLLDGAYVYQDASQGTVSPERQYVATAKALGGAYTGISYKSLLGDSINFGVVTDYYEQRWGDAETNVAALKAICTTQTGNDLTNRVEQTFMFGEVENQFNIKGFDAGGNGEENAYIIVPSSDKDKVRATGGTHLIIDDEQSKEQISQTIGNMRSYAQGQSEMLAGLAPNAVVEKVSDNQYKLDLTGRGAGTFVVDLGNDMYAGAMGGSSHLRITKDDSQTVVFNVTASDEVVRNTGVQKFEINGVGSDRLLSSNPGANPRTVVFNYPMATDIPVRGSIAAIVLAPNATWRNDATSSGWIDCKHFVVGSGEWHNNYDNVTKLRAGGATFRAKKMVNGSEAQVNGFEFLLERVDGNALSAADQEKSRTVKSVGPEVAFGRIAYGASDLGDQASASIVYKISEQGSQTIINDVAYGNDSRVVYAKVDLAKRTTVANNVTTTDVTVSGPTYYTDQECTTTITDADGVPVFNNSTLDQTKHFDTFAVIQGFKELTGRPVREGEFTFGLFDEEGNAVKDEDDNVITAENDEKGHFALLTPTYEEVGEHNYIVKELPGDEPGVTYSTQEYRVTVKVTDDGTGNLSATASVQDGSEIRFKNSYEASGSLGISGTKRVAAGSSVWTSGLAGFKFRLSSDDPNAPMPEGTAEATTLDDGSFSFGEINFSQANVGNYVYTVTEDGDTPLPVGGLFNRSYTVHVADKGDGTMSVYADEDSAHASAAYALTLGDVYNTYDASGSLELGGVKRLEGRAFKGDVFGFTVAGTEKGTQNPAPMPERTSASASATSGDSADFSFGSVSYGLDDVGKTYVYTITENELTSDQAAAGLSRDESVKVVEVSVSDPDHNGTLKVDATWPDGLADGARGVQFTNHYGASARIAIPVAKTISGRDFRAGDKFTFKIQGNTKTDYSDEVVLTPGAGASAVGSFAEMEFTTADAAENGGDYWYTVTEESAESRGGAVSKSDEVWRVKIHVADDGNGTLSLTPTYYKGAEGDDVETSISFENAYHATGSISLTAEKDYTAFGEKRAIDRDFSFALTGDDLPEGGLHAIAGREDGVARFDQLSYDLDQVKAASGARQVGGLWSAEFHYAVTEDVPAAAERVAGDTNTYVYEGVTYDATPHDVTVTVSDGGDGHLNVVATKAGDANAVVLNTYSVAGEAEVLAHKELLGRDLSAGEFSFALKGLAGDETYMDTAGVLETAQNDADGNITFGLSYTRPGAYRYELSEVTANGGGVTVDGARYLVTVIMKDDGRGGLARESVTYSKWDGAGYVGESTDEPTFQNVYEASAEIVPVATKHIVADDGGKTSRDSLLAGKRFSFQLKNAAGEVIGEKQSDENGLVVFDAITYTQDDLKNADGSYSDSKEFSYTISEKPGQAVAGITSYDTHAATMAVTVSRGSDGAITAVPTYSTDGGAAFTNVYGAAGSASFSATKVVEDARGAAHAVAAGAYSFRLDGYKADGVVKAIGADGTATFDGIKYTLDDLAGSASKDFEYTISEVVPDVADRVPGIAYDAAPQTVRVHVADAGDGTLAVTYGDADDESAPKLTFTNHYDAQGSIGLAVDKSVVDSAGNARSASGYKFVLDGPKADSVVATSDDNGHVAFPSISYTLDDLAGEASKTFEYTVSEQGAGKVENGVSYTSDAIKVAVTVADKGDGTLSATASYPAGGATLINTYAASGEVTLSGTKALLGSSMTDAQFGFSVRDEHGAVVASGTSKADGTIEFTKISYADLSAVGTHTYSVSENLPDGVSATSPTKNGITYDTSVKTVTVSVADAGDGRLVADITYPEGGLAFTNSYDASGKVELATTKTFVSNSEATILEPGEFSFGLFRSDGTTPVIDAESNQQIVATNDAQGNVVFPAISYGAADAGKTYDYVIRELVPEQSNAGITYDDHAINVSVAVTDAGDGTLSAVATYSASDGQDENGFTNTYEVEDAQVQLFARKQLSVAAGIDRKLADDEFFFTLTEVDADGKHIENGVTQTKANDADGNVAFDSITYGPNDEGDHYYQIAEKNDHKVGFTYDESVKTVCVSVFDMHDGTMMVAYNDEQELFADDVTFTNAYAPVWTSDVKIEGTKSLSGRDMRDGEFSFGLYEGGELVASAANEGGRFAFDLGSFDMPGTHEYVVREVAGSEPGVSYDASEFPVTVTVADDGQGRLTADVAYPEGEPSFSNSFEARGSVSLSGTKVVESAPGTEQGPGGFTFTLTPLSGGDALTATTGDDGRFSFELGGFTQDDAGRTFSYTLDEQARDGFAKRFGPRTVSVGVSLAPDGTLSVVADGLQRSGDGSYDLGRFVNAYAASPASASVGGTKSLSGRDMRDGEFEFQLYREGAAKPMATARNIGSSFSFDLGTFTEPGEYEYYVREVIGELGGVTYDTTEFPVNVRVSDDGDGQLVASVNYPHGKPLFSNGYTAEGALSLTATKVLNGATLTDGQFQFQVTDEKGEVVSTATNTADGAIAFSPINYTIDDLGQHVYTVSEVTSNDPSVTYDTSAHQIEVNVTDNGNGTLAIAYKNGDAWGADQPSVTFTNSSFKAEASVSAVKHFYGEGDPDFTFMLRAADEDFNVRSANGSVANYGADATVVDDGLSPFVISVANGAFADGQAKVAFPAITYHQAGVYHYVLGESMDRDDANDAAIYNVTVTIGNDQTATVSYQTADGTAVSEAEFYNNANIRLAARTAKAALALRPMMLTSVDPKVSKKLEGAMLEAGQFDFRLTQVDADGKAIENGVSQIASNAADGAVSFGRIMYTEPGTYTYAITEEVRDEKAVVFDKSTILLTVEVTEDGDGALQVKETYSKDGSVVEDPTFTNIRRTIVVRTQKKSKEAPYEPLQGAVYGLWMANPDGNDVYLGNQTSGADGYITFDVPLQAGVAYYFKEEKAPAKHLVDPVRSKYFTLIEKSGTYKLAYEGTPEFVEAVPGLQK